MRYFTALILTKVALATALNFPQPAKAEDFTVKSNDIKQDQTLSIEQVFKGFGCEGKNLSPQLEWSGAPKETKSFAITCYDPDAPTGSGWWHWSVFNIPANVMTLEKNASVTKLPNGAVQGRTDFGTSEFGGACPPVGDKAHRYIFTVFALNTDKIDLDKNASGALVGYYLNQHAIAKTSITAKYKR